VSEAGPALAGSVVVVTGGASGIGLGCVQRLLEADARVVVADVRPVPDELAGACTYVRTDMADTAAVDEAMEHLPLDRPSYAVNCAGIGGPTVPLAELGDDDWVRVLDVNLSGTFRALRAQLSRMAPGSAVVNMGSVLGERADAAASSAYVASKFGVVGLTRMAAVQGGPRGIRVNAVAPGRILTPLLRSIVAPEVLAQRAGANPLGRLGDVQDVAAAVEWLLGPASAYVNGTVLPVDGGFLAM